MGNCSYCSQPAGILRSKHSECAKQHARSQEQIRQAIVQCILTRTNASKLSSVILPIARQGFVRTSEFNDLIVDGWSKAVDLFLEDGMLSPVEESSLMDFAQQAGLEPKLQQHPSYSQVAKAAQLRDLAEGKCTSRMSFNGPQPINLQKGETLIWAFPGTQYLEDRERKEFVGTSHGVSVRVMKGVYYRVGAFKGRPVTHLDRVNVGTGTLFVTTKHLCFAGSPKSVRIPYSKIISFEQYSDGIGIMRDAASAKPQTFITGDGWFTFNLISQVSQL
jgi:hypothetical protein